MGSETRTPSRGPMGRGPMGRGAVEKPKNFTLSHRGKPMEISKFILTFATKSAWNWQEQPWLVIRRQFESNWFKWIKRPIWEYQRKYYERR